MSLVKTEHIAKEFGYTPQHVRRLARDGRIPYFKIGSRYRFDLESVRQCLVQEGGANGYRSKNES